MIITAPTQSDGRLLPNLFLAGGISNCPDWQSYVLSKIGHIDYNIYNPRRIDWNYDANAEIESTKQIEWEHKYLAQSDEILFWFPKETVCPITLLEYGKFLMIGYKRLYVGVHPEYIRKLDIYVQTKLERPDIEIVDNLDDLIQVVLNASTERKEQHTRTKNALLCR